MLMVVRGGVGDDGYAHPRISIHRSIKLIHICMLHMGMSCCIAVLSCCLCRLLDLYFLALAYEVQQHTRRIHEDSATSRF